MLLAGSAEPSWELPQAVRGWDWTPPVRDKSKELHAGQCGREAGKESFLLHEVLREAQAWWLRQDLQPYKGDRCRQAGDLGSLLEAMWKEVWEASRLPGRRWSRPQMFDPWGCHPRLERWGAAWSPWERQGRGGHVRFRFLLYSSL